MKLITRQSFIPCEPHFLDSFVPLVPGPLWAQARGWNPSPRGQQGKSKGVRCFLEKSEGIPGRTWWRSRAVSGCPPLGSGAWRGASRGRVGRRWLRCESFPLRSGSHWHRGRSYNSTRATRALGHTGATPRGLCTVPCPAPAPWASSASTKAAPACPVSHVVRLLHRGSQGHQPLPSVCLGLQGFGIGLL